MSGTEIELNSLLKEVREKGVADRRQIEKLKLALARKIGRIPRNSELISLLDEKGKRVLRNLLIKKPVRSISGVSVIAVMTSPAPCPHGRCIYCPGGPLFDTPQSYTGREPASMRGAEFAYDPYLQFRARMKALEENGHPTSKIELIVMGGTFPARSWSYQRWFVKCCFDAANNEKASSLEEAHALNERSSHRIIGLTIETRPDFCKEEHVDKMLALGCTRVEIGVQTIYDDILEKVRRGHTVRDTIDATRIARDSGLKICYHLMPGLPGSSLERDLEMFEMILEDSNFMPDMLKIYPTLVIPGTELHKMYLRGDYRPYSMEDLVSLLVEIKKIVPRWVRIMRVNRDIPTNIIVDGVKKSNLRQIVLDRLKELGLRCECIRCREIGHKLISGEISPSDLGKLTFKLNRYEYEAAGGIEIFLAFENEELDALAGYLRLRFPMKRVHREEVTPRSALVRELHVYGPEVPVGSRDEGAIQHRGLGRRLLKEAERIALEEFDCEKILVTSGVGARPYYRSLGYTRDGPYMSKTLEA